MRKGEKTGVTAANPETLKCYGISLTPFRWGLQQTVGYFYEQMGEMVSRASHPLPANIQHGQNYGS